MSATAVVPGLTSSEWATLLTLIDECSPEQLDDIRNLINREKETMEAPPARDAQVTSVAKTMAMEIWDRYKADSDPAAADLPPETLDRIVTFAREVRNATLDQVAAAVSRGYSKFTATIVESLEKQKE